MMKQELNFGVVWFFDNIEQFSMFKISFSLIFLRNKNKIKYYVYYNQESELANEFNEFNDLFGGVINTIKDNKHIKIFEECGLDENLMLSSTIAPFFVDVDRLLFLDNDTLPNVNIFELFDSHLEKGVAIQRRIWNIFTSKASIRFHEDYYNLNAENVNNVNGNGGVILYDVNLFKIKFENNYNLFLNEMKNYIKKQIDHQETFFETSAISNRKMFLCDEVFLNVNFYANSKNTLPVYLNCSLNIDWKKIDETIDKENFIFHIADNPNGIKKLVYNNLIFEFNKEIFISNFENNFKYGENGFKNKDMLLNFIEKIQDLIKNIIN